MRVRSAAVADGYFPSRTRRNLAAAVSFRTICSAGTPHGLRIVGRISDVINVAGKKVNPAEVEAELLRFAGVREAASSSAANRPCAMKKWQRASLRPRGERVRFARVMPPSPKRLAGPEANFLDRSDPGK